MKHNPFGIIRSISQSDPYYMLFEYYSDSCDPIYCTKAKLIFFIVMHLLLFLAYQFKADFWFFCQLK
jgi:hypothetical protein